MNIYWYTTVHRIVVCTAHKHMNWYTTVHRIVLCYLPSLLRAYTMMNISCVFLWIIKKCSHANCNIINPYVLRQLTVTKLQTNHYSVQRTHCLKLWKDCFRIFLKIRKACPYWVVMLITWSQLYRRIQWSFHGMKRHQRTSNCNDFMNHILSN